MYWIFLQEITAVFVFAHLAQKNDVTDENMIESTEWTGGVILLKEMGLVNNIRNNCSLTPYYCKNISSTIFSPDLFNGVRSNE